MPKFSIIITTCNRKNFFERALKSAINQKKFDDYEIIIVNNGGESVDDIIQKYEKIKKINLINYTERKGPAISANIGIKNSNAEWICFLDDDDELLPNYLEELNKNITKKDNWILILAIWKKNYIEKVMLDKKLFKINSPEDLLKNIFKIYVFRKPLSIIKKDIFEKLGYFDENLNTNEDLDFMFRLILNNYIFKLIPKPLYIYYIHPYQSIHKYDVLIKDYLKIFEKYKNLFEKYKEIQSGLYYTIGWHYVRLNDEKKAYNFFKNSFILKPSLKTFIRMVMANLELNRKLQIEKIINKILGKFWLE